MANYGWRPHIESALCLRLPHLLKRRAVVPGCTTSGAWQWTRDGERVASLAFNADLGDETGRLVLTYRADGRDVTETITLSSIPNHYGGRNWFMHCPYTGRRARCLYKWASLPGFRHREAVRPRPTYASQRDGGTSRILRQRWALRRKMGDEDSDLFSEPMKPKWMRWATYDRFAARDAELEAREGAAWVSLLGRLGVDL
ncbi:MAG: hypothetical protein IT318_27625 [Anaerolineales bacterium]|nr:hypothetical protein [Anaerolineales bacterium]